MVKEKPDQIRTYDKDGYKRRAACLCFRDEKEDEVKMFVYILFTFFSTMFHLYDNRLSCCLVFNLFLRMSCACGSLVIH
jgi:hypothetical protein